MGKFASCSMWYCRCWPSRVQCEELGSEAEGGEQKLREPLIIQRRSSIGLAAENNCCASAFYSFSWVLYALCVSSLTQTVFLCPCVQCLHLSR